MTDWESKQIDIPDTSTAKAKLSAETRGGWEIVSVIQLAERVRIGLDEITVPNFRYTFKRSKGGRNER